MDVAQDHNPLRPETHARALWAAAEMLTGARGFQVMLMRHASMPMAMVLRKSFAAASARFEAAGITPAAYRTLILPASARRDRTHDTDLVPELNRIRRSMPMPLATTAEMPTAAAAVDPQLMELLSRLFDALLADRRLAPDMQLLLSRLQSSALRVVLRDAGALDDQGHPLWLFLDRLAFQAEILPAAGDAERSRLQRHAQAIVEHLIGVPEQDAALYRWALGRLEAFEKNRLAERCAAASGEIAALQRLEGRLLHTATPPSTDAGALDAGQLDTVPAELFSAAGPTAVPTESESTLWLEGRRPGDWFQVVLQGQWVHAQLLWPGARGEVWLMADSASPRTWAVRRGALRALHAAGLLETLGPRSLLRDAAQQVIRRLQTTQAR